MAKVTRIGPETAPEPDQFDIYDLAYSVRRLTRSVQIALDKVDEKLVPMLNGEDSDSDKIVALMAEAIGSLLVPVGHEKSAKTWLVDLWKKDTLSVDEVHRLYTGIQDSAAARPTSALSN